MPSEAQSPEAQSLQAQSLQIIHDLVGPSGWIEAGDSDSYSKDWRLIYDIKPLAVVRPATAEEASKVIDLCREGKIAIVSQGGNTGLSGGAAAYADRACIILSTTRMTKILDVDPQSFTITAEAGVTIQAIQEAAVSVDREFGVDWGARGTATVGGAVSTDAGGINVLRSGTMREQVLGIEVVLPDGQIWNGLRSLRKDASGYGLKHLFIGAEGTLGLVTKAVLKLEPRRSHRQSFLATVPEFDRLPELYSLAQDIGQKSLAAFELIPERGLAAVCEQFDGVTRPLETISDWYVLGQMASNSSVTGVVEQFLTDATERGLMGDAAVAGGPAQEANLWMMRDELPPEHLLGISGAKFDVAVPVAKVAGYYRKIEALAAEIDERLMTYAFGHLGDGNLHLYLFLNPDLTQSPMDLDLKSLITSQVDEITWAMGGTISAEHGIGQDLRDRMAGQKSNVELDLLRRVKSAIDPTDLFNPGRGSNSAPA